MAIYKLIMLIALVVPICVLAHDDAALYSSQYYLKLPSQDQFDEPFHKTVREALQNLDISRRSIAVILNLAKNNANIDKTHRQVYDIILSVSRRDDRCPKQLVEVYISIMAQACSKDRRLLTFEKFMNLAEPQKFKLCARIVNKEFKLNPVEPEAAHEFFYVLKKTFDLKSGSTKEELHEKLMRFSLARHTFNAVKMVEAARDIDTVPLIESKRTDDYNYLRDFWLIRCQQFDDDPLNRMLNMLSVARSLSFKYTEYDVRLLLLNEYRRLCYEWQDHKDHGDQYPEIEINIRRLLNQPSLRMLIGMAGRFFKRKD